MLKFCLLCVVEDKQALNKLSFLLDYPALVSSSKQVVAFHSLSSSAQPDIAFQAMGPHGHIAMLMLKQYIVLSISTTNISPLF